MKMQKYIQSYIIWKVMICAGLADAVLWSELLERIKWGKMEG